MYHHGWFCIQTLLENSLVSSCSITWCENLTLENAVSPHPNPFENSLVSSCFYQPVVRTWLWKDLMWKTAMTEGRRWGGETWKHQAKFPALANCVCSRLLYGAKGRWGKEVCLFNCVEGVYWQWCITLVSMGFHSLHSSLLLYDTKTQKLQVGKLCPTDTLIFWEANKNENKRCCIL